MREWAQPRRLDKEAPSQAQAEREARAPTASTTGSTSRPLPSRPPASPCVDCHTFVEHAMQVAVENKRRNLLTPQSARERQIPATHRASVVARKPTRAPLRRRHMPEK